MTDPLNHWLRLAERLTGDDDRAADHYPKDLHLRY